LTFDVAWAIKGRQHPVSHGFIVKNERSLILKVDWLKNNLESFLSKVSGIQAEGVCRAFII
jgi:hypothetical protein